MFKKLKGLQGGQASSNSAYIACTPIQTGVLLQDLVLDQLYWIQLLLDGETPEAVVELVKYSYVASKCSGRCSCKAHYLACTELCKCQEQRTRVIMLQ